MGLQSSVGIAVGISAVLPTTHDAEVATGFPSLTYTAAGKLSAAAPMTGTKDVATFDNLTTITALRLSRPTRRKALWATC